EDFRRELHAHPSERTRFHRHRGRSHHVVLSGIREHIQRGGRVPESGTGLPPQRRHQRRTDQRPLPRRGRRHGGHGGLHRRGRRHPLLALILGGFGFFRWVLLSTPTEFVNVRYVYV